MICAVLEYLWNEAGPRFLKIVGASDFILAVLVAGAVGIWGHKMGLAAANIVDLTIALLTYSAIAFGFCLSGLTLVLVLPDLDFARHLASSQVKQDAPNAYSDLMFIFSWTALIHWFDIVAVIAVFAFYGSGQKVLPPNASSMRHVVIGVLVFLSVYAICRFLVALITLSQVGRLYVLKLAKPTKPVERTSE